MFAYIYEFQNVNCKSTVIVKVEKRVDGNINGVTYGVFMYIRQSRELN